MIKKFVSNALLSVVMDKKARAKFNSLQESKRRGKVPADEPNPEPDADLEIPRMVPEPKSRPDPAPAPPRPPVDTTDEDPAALIRQALESAEAELTRKQNRKQMSPERQALIEQAMAIHRSKSHILDDLDEEQREKLYVMAMQTLNNKSDK